MCHSNCHNNDGSGGVGNLSNNRTNQPSNSGFFLFEDTFYNDLRHEDNIDYSESIISFARERRAEKKRKRQKQHFYDEDEDDDGSDQHWIDIDYKKKSMADTKFRDLRLRCGNVLVMNNYLYCHQGCCEHKIVIADVRCVHESDEQERIKYPIQTLVRRVKGRPCVICSQRAR